MSKGYKTYLFVVGVLFGVILLVAWKFGVLDLLFDTYYTPPSEWLN